MSKPFFFVFTIVIFLVFFFNFHSEKKVDQSIKIVFCDVGQGDSILIQQGFFQAVVDSGQGDGVLRCLGRFRQFWDREIEMILLSHFDKDHVGSFGKILDMYSVKTLFFTDTPKNTSLVAGLQEAILEEQSHGALVKRPILGQVVSFSSGGKITFLHIPPEIGEESELSLSENNRSLAFLLEYDDVKLLFIGDLEEERERFLVKQGVLPEVNVLKVGHHGSETSSSEAFLQAISPEIAVISAGKGNQYGHPSPEIVKRLQKLGAMVLRTDEMGDVVMTIRDKKIFIEK